MQKWFCCRLKRSLNRLSLAAALTAVLFQAPPALATVAEEVAGDALRILKECGDVQAGIRLIDQQLRDQRLRELKEADGEAAARLYLKRGFMGMFNGEVDVNESKRDFDHAVEIAPEFCGNETTDQLLLLGIYVWETKCTEYAPEGLMSVVFLLMAHKGDAAAEKYLDGLLQKWPDCSMARQFRAMVKFRSGRQQGAIDDLNAIPPADDKNRPTTLAMLFDVYSELGDKDSAMALCPEWVRACRGDKASLPTLLVSICKSENKLTGPLLDEVMQAGQEYVDLAETDNEKFEAKFLLAEINYLAGRKSEAGDLFLEAQKALPGGIADIEPSVKRMSDHTQLRLAELLRSTR